MKSKKLFRVTTVPLSLDKLLEGQLSYINKVYEVTAISSDYDYLVQVGEKEQVKTHAIEMSRKISPFQDLKSIWKMYFFLKKEKPLIVHTHTPKAGMVGMITSKMAGVPLRLHTVAGLPLMEATGVKRKVLNFVEKVTYNCATMVYPNSKGLYDFIVKEKFTKMNKLKVLANGSSNGIDTNYFSSIQISDKQKQSLKNELQINDTDFVFIFVGRLVKDKGINELVEAFSKIEYSNCKLLLVGPFEEDLDPLDMETLKRISNNKNIISVGFQKDVRPYFAISNVLVFPSYREGFPNVVMQAGAMELPCIVSDINGCNEIIVPNENGIIISPKDKGSLLNAMRLLFEEKNLCKKLEQNSREMIVAKYEQKVVWNAILAEYKRLEQNV